MIRKLPRLMDNYEYCANFALETCKFGSVLDYGCGLGRIVGLLRKQQIEAFGCDVFYEGGKFNEGGSLIQEVPDEMLGTTVLTMEGGRIPFQSDVFD